MLDYSPLLASPAKDTNVISSDIDAGKEAKIKEGIPRFMSLTCSSYSSKHRESLFQMFI